MPHSAALMRHIIWATLSSKLPIITIRSVIYDHCDIYTKHVELVCNERDYGLICAVLQSDHKQK